MNRVRELRERYGPSSCRALARATGIRDSALQLIETQQQELDEAKIRALAAYWNIHPGEFYEPLPPSEEAARALSQALNPRDMELWLAFGRRLVTDQHQSLDAGND